MRSSFAGKVALITGGTLWNRARNGSRFCRTRRQRCRRRAAWGRGSGVGQARWEDRRHRNCITGRRRCSRVSLVPWSVRTRGAK